MPRVLPLKNQYQCQRFTSFIPMCPKVLYPYQGIRLLRPLSLSTAAQYRIEPLCSSWRCWGNTEVYQWIYFWLALTGLNVQKFAHHLLRYWFELNAWLQESPGNPLGTSYPLSGPWRVLPSCCQVVFYLLLNSGQSCLTYEDIKGSYCLGCQMTLILALIRSYHQNQTAVLCQISSHQ